MASPRLRVIIGIVSTFLLVVGLFSAGCLPIGPIGLLPGGRLRGVEHAGAPPSWSKFSAERTLELQVAPESPHSVNVGVLVIRDRLFVPATLRPDEKRWPRAIEKDPRVVVRLHGTLYPLRATRVHDPGLVSTLLEAGQNKYDPSYFEPERTWFFELERRR